MSEADDRSTNAIREAAAQWVIRLGGANVTLADKTAFAAWLRRSPVHVREYLQAEAAWSRVDEEAGRDPTEVEALLKMPPDNVAELRLPGNAVEMSEATPLETLLGDERRSGFNRWRIAATVAVAVLIGSLLFVLGPRVLDRFDPNLLATGVGEQRRVVLTDGSAVELNTRSKLRVSLSKTAREIQLIEGEAFFEVAKDPSRPFRVISDTTVVRAVGTQFNVYRREHGTTVAVIEGRVAIERRDGSGLASSRVEGGPHRQPDSSSALEVGAGHVVRIEPSKAIEPLPAKPEMSIAWRQHRLIFENEALDKVVAEFNRYNARPLIVEDTELAALRISGVFDPHRPGDLVGFLEQNGDARAEILKQRVLLVAPSAQR